MVSMGAQSLLLIMVSMYVCFTKGHLRVRADAWDMKKPDICRAQA